MMCRLLSTLLILLTLVTASPVQAQANCASVDAVWDSVTLIRKMQRNDTPALRARLRETLVPLSENTLPRLNQFAELIENDLASGATAQSLLATALSQNLSSGLQTISIENDCDGLPSSVLSEVGTESGADGGGQGFDSLSEVGEDNIRQTGASRVSDLTEGGPPQFISGILFQGDLIVFFSMLAALIALPILIYIRRTSKAYLQREERRMLLEPVRVRLGREEVTMTLVDISMNGFKLRHDGKIENTPKLFVNLNGDWAAGTVRWSNEQFAGVKFNRAISETTLKIVLDRTEERLAA